MSKRARGAQTCAIVRVATTTTQSRLAQMAEGNALSVLNLQLQLCSVFHHDWYTWCLGIQCCLDYLRWNCREWNGALKSKQHIFVYKKDPHGYSHSNLDLCKRAKLSASPAAHPDILIHLSSEGSLFNAIRRWQLETVGVARPKRKNKVHESRIVKRRDVDRTRQVDLRR